MIRMLLALTLLLGSFITPASALQYVALEYMTKAGVTADAAVKSGAGTVHTVTCAGTDAAATAGSVSILDSTSAGAGTTLLTIAFVAAYFPPVTITLDYQFTTGLYLDFASTADVMCTVSYR